MDDVMEVDAERGDIQGENVPKIKKIDITEFRESGLLHELNRQFLHPLGMALETEQEDGAPEVLGGIWDYRDDPEGILFTTLDRKKMEKAGEFIQEQHKKRMKAIGFVVQEEDMDDEPEPTNQFGYA